MAKKLIVCADGTWNNPAQRDRGHFRPSNVVKIAQGLTPYDHDQLPQIIYYEPGIGTEGILDPWVSGFTGLGLSHYVKAAYTFLINNFQPGDRVYCFGFSRGAFIVRSLCGLIGKVGLLKKRYLYLYNDAYELYRRGDIEAESPEVQGFRKGCVHEDPIDDIRNPFILYFIGVWDTVGALGIPFTGIGRFNSRDDLFHDTTLNPYLPYAYHALAIDEHRKPFVPTVWKRAQSAHNQEIQQVWFAGAHSNVGGGYECTGLANIAFIWMQERAQTCGLVFDQDYIYEIYYKAQNHLGELRDSISGIYTYLPKYYRPIGEVNPDGTSVITGERIHESVLLRCKEMGEKYAPPNLPGDIEHRIPVVPYTPIKIQ